MHAARLSKAAGALSFGAAVPFSWRFVEQNFHNDNRLSWWLSHLSSPLD